MATVAAIKRFREALALAVRAAAPSLAPQALVTVAHSMYRLAYRDELTLTALLSRTRALLPHQAPDSLPVIVSEAISPPANAPSQQHKDSLPNNDSRSNHGGSAAVQQHLDLQLRDVAQLAVALSQLQCPGIPDLLSHIEHAKLFPSSPSGGPAAVDDLDQQHLGVSRGHKLTSGHRQSLFNLAWAHAVADVHEPWMAKLVVDELIAVEKEEEERDNMKTASAAGGSSASHTRSSLPSGLNALDRAQAFHYLIMVQDVGLLPPMASLRPHDNDMDRLLASAWQRCKSAWLSSSLRRPVDLMGDEIISDSEMSQQTTVLVDTAENETGIVSSTPEVPLTAITATTSPSSPHKIPESLGTVTSLLQRDVWRVMQQLNDKVRHPSAEEAEGDFLKGGESGESLEGYRHPGLLDEASISLEHLTEDGLFSIDMAIIVPLAAVHPRARADSDRTELALTAKSPVSIDGPLRGSLGDAKAVCSPSLVQHDINPTSAAIDDSIREVSSYGEAEGRGGDLSLSSDREISSMSQHIHIAIEVDGPTHFMAASSADDAGELWRPLGATELRNRCLMRRGWRVLCLPWWDWDVMVGDDEAKRRYLTDRIGALCISVAG